MQKKKFIYVLYCCLAVLAVALFLIFYKNVKQQKPENSINPTTPEYASSFNLLCPNNITVLVGGQVELRNYISIQPESMANSVIPTVAKYTGETTNGITYANNIITAKEVGAYRISFKVLSDENSYLNRTIMVNVKSAEEYGPVKQISSSFMVDKNRNTLDMFRLNLGETVPEILSLNANVQVVNNEFIPKEAGQAVIKINLNYEFVKYSYNFNFEVLPKPVYSINIINYSSSIITTEKDRLKIQYHITDTENEFAIQTITATSSDLEVAIIESCDAPFIVLNRKNSGQRH